MVGRIEIEVDVGAPYDDGGPGEPDRRARRSQRWVRYGPVAVALAVFAGAAVWHERGDDLGPLTPTTTTAPARPTVPSSAATTVDTAAIARRSRRAVTLPPAATEHLVVRRTDGSFVELDAATGAANEIVVPPLDSTGAVYVVAGEGWTAVRPMDFVAGYLLDGDRPAERLQGGLDTGTFTFLPGPLPRTVWIDSGDTGISLTLYGLDGTPVAAPFRMATSREVLGGDGDGQVAAAGPGGVYVTSSGGWRRITTGRLLALGPTAAVAEECDEHLACVDAVIDRRTGERRVLYDPARRALGDGVLGAVSPDGRWAALSDGSGTRIDVVDLASGSSVTVAITARSGNRPVWSPDGRRVWFVDDAGGVGWYDVTTATGGQLVLGDAERFALRAAPPGGAPAAPLDGAPS